MSSIRVSARFLVGLSLAWLAVLAVVPWLHDQQVSFLASAALLLANTLFTLRMLTRERRVPIVLNFVQIVLFGVLNYQLLITYGEDHYRLDRPPEFVDWAEFTLGHLCRAADVLDTLDEYGVDLQNIRPSSLTAKLLIVAMHLGADVFLIGLVVRWWARLRRTPGENLLERGRRNLRWFLATMSIYPGIGLIYRFSTWDWVFWPVDNVLRLLDIGDMFQVFHWKLHEVDKGFLTSTCSLAFRVAFGGWTAEIVLWLHFSCLRGWGMDIGELRAILRDGDTFARQGAARTLATCGRRARPALDELITSLSDCDIEVRCDAARALGGIGPRARKAVPALSLCLWSEHRQLRLAAAGALEHMGDAAEEAVPDLIFLMVVGEEALRKIACRTLYRFGYEPKG
jgi:hypothetical protein